MSIPDKVRKALRKRAEIDDHPCCECCGYPYASNAHHRRNRSRGGRDVLSNLVLLCGSGTTGCHGQVTEHPDDATEAGLTIQSEVTPPQDVPVVLRGERVLLADDGSVSPAPLGVLPVEDDEQRLGWRTV